MKKLLCIWVCLMILLAFTACANDDGVPSAPTQAADGLNGDPPRTVYISSCEDLYSLADAANLTNAKLSQVMMKQSYTESGLQGKSELLDFSQLMQSVGYPIFEDTQKIDSFYMRYLPEVGLYNNIYRIDGIRYQFEYTKFEAFAGRENMIPVVTCSIEDADLVLYKGDGCLVGEIYANGYQIRVVVDHYADYSDLDFERFRWSTDMVYMK